MSYPSSKSIFGLHLPSPFTIWIALFFLFFSLFPLVRCASLPPAEDQIEQAVLANPLLEMISAHRAIPLQESQEIIERLEKEVGPTDILTRHILVMQEISGLPLVEGNKVTLLIDGPATYASMFEAIRNAKDHINLETFKFGDDEVGVCFAELLLQKQAEGVQVNLIYDSAGSFETPRALFNQLKECGIQVLEFNPIDPFEVQGEWLLTHRDHRKILVVDGKVAFTGGINISSVYSGSLFGSESKEKKIPWRDTDVRIEGPAVAQLQELFLETWKRQNGQPLASKNYFPPLKKENNELIRVIGSRAGEKNRLTYLMYVSAIMFASKYIYLTDAYFVPDGQMVRALCDASRRGIDVRLILPRFNDIKLVLYAGRSYYQELLESGIKLYERRNRMLHAKTAVIDSVWSTIGSTNLDRWSFLRDNEVNAIIIGPDFAGQMETLFRKDLESSDQIDLEKWKKRPLSERFKEWFARLFHYWL
jgi:cardiolipin synthase